MATGADGLTLAARENVAGEPDARREIAAPLCQAAEAESVMANPLNIRGVTLDGAVQVCTDRKKNLS